MSLTLEDLRYPIGPFQPPDQVTQVQVDAWIDDIAMLPVSLRQTVSALTDEQLDTPYRPSGWTVRQVVHHLPDSHINSFVRVKWALTEDRPVIKAYDERRWAVLPDSRETVAHSLDLLGALHRRWESLLRGLDWPQLQRGRASGLGSGDAGGHGRVIRLARASSSGAHREADRASGVDPITQPRGPLPASDRLELASSRIESTHP